MMTETTFKMDCEIVAGVAFDGRTLWASLLDDGKGSLARIDRETGRILSRQQTPKISGLTHDGERLWAVTPEAILCLDPESLAVVRSLPRPKDVAGFLSGLAWDGEALWVGDAEGMNLLKIDPATGAVLRRLASDRFVTGITWVGSELWHATGSAEDDGLATELRRVDADSGAVVERYEMPYVVSGLDHDGDRFWCGDCESGTLRGVAHGRKVHA